MRASLKSQKLKDAVFVITLTAGEGRCEIYSSSWEEAFELLSNHITYSIRTHIYLFTYTYSLLFYIFTYMDITGIDTNPINTYL